MEKCPQCCNVQPVLRQCSSCDVKTFHTCVENDCWGLKSPGKPTLWMCHACQPDKENEAPNQIKIATKNEKYSVQLFENDECLRGECVGKKNFFVQLDNSPKIRSPGRKSCSRCGNKQPVFRGCSRCSSRNYYTCVSPDCWDLQLEASGSEDFWICYVCKSGNEKTEPVQEEKKHSGDEYDESEIFEIMGLSSCQSLDCQAVTPCVDGETQREEEKKEDKISAFGGFVDGHFREEIPEIKNEEIHEAKLEIEDAMNEEITRPYRFRDLQKFWEGVSGNSDKK